MTVGTTTPKRAAPAMTVCAGSSSAWPVLFCANLTMNGSALFTTNFMMPRAMRRIVASFSGRSRSKIDGHGIVQSMQSAAVRQGANLPARTAAPFGSPCVGVGHTIGSPSRRATRKKRLRMVGAPKSHARSSRWSTV
ncbi:Uncharacterised protein [Burkholderia gladioli]|nr:Uncharacterised protein [Burkholderia gladioli]